MNCIVAYKGSESSGIDNSQPLESKEVDDTSDISIDVRSSAANIAKHICESNFNKLNSKTLINLLN